MLTYMLQIVEDEDRPNLEALIKNNEAEVLRYIKVKLIDCYLDPCFEYQDVVQQTYLKLSLSVKKIDFTRSPRELRCYVYQTVDNVVRDLIKDSHVAECLDDEALDSKLSEDDFFEQMDIHQSFCLVVEELAKMPDNYGSLLDMFYMHSMTPTQIAEELKIPRDTVYSRLRRGRETLLEVLKVKGVRQ